MSDNYREALLRIDVHLGLLYATLDVAIECPELDLTNTIRNLADRIDDLIPNSIKASRPPEQDAP